MSADLDRGDGSGRRTEFRVPLRDRQCDCMGRSMAPIAQSLLRRRPRTIRTIVVHLCQLRIPGAAEAAPPMLWTLQKPRASAAVR
jgi:hypothetical protein